MIVCQRIVAAVAIVPDIIIVRTGHRYRMVIFLQNGDIGEILDASAVLQSGSARLPGDIAQFGPVHQDAAADFQSVGKREPPAFRKAFQAPQPGSETQLHTRLPGHVGKDFRPDTGVEQDIGHPTRFQGLVPPVTGGKRIGELTENTSAQPVVPIHGTDTGARQHTAQPERGFDDQHGYAVPGRFDGCRRPAGTPADNNHIVVCFAGPQPGQAA